MTINPLNIYNYLRSEASFVDMHLVLFHKLASHHDDPDFFAYIQTPYWHSFGKVSQSQIDSFSIDFLLKETQLPEGTSLDQITNHPVTIHKDYEQAISENYRLNLAIPYLFYCPENKLANLSDDDGKKYLNISLRDNLTRYSEEWDSSTEEERKTFTPIEKFVSNVASAHYKNRSKLSTQTILEAISLHPILELIYNDYSSIIFKKSQKIDYKNADLFVFLPETFNPKFSKIKSYSQLVALILNNQQVSKQFKTELQSYLIKNILATHKTKNDNSCLYTLNQNLLNQLILLSEYITFSNYTWTQITKLLNRFADEDFYFTELMFCDVKNDEDGYYKAFIENLNFLKNQNFDIYQTLYHWNLFHSTMKSSAQLLKDVNFKLDPKRYKDLNRTYNFIGKKLSENIEDFNLENINGVDFNNNIQELESVKIAGYSISVIKTFKDLFNIGIILDNCAGSKITLPYYQDKLVYILSNGNKTYLGCLSDGQFHQLKGYKNSSPEFFLFESLFKELVRLNFACKLENQKISKRYQRKYGQNLAGLYEQECVQH